ncbi:MAG: SMC-Scp complex subunit ScpB [Firmicutes bacterium HGW-Firmicutes-1]|jgi:segregation and condensation protein B|nr:MAG: SMC-Scp complex subunit ScpB [Firmicutes bacterium HGW-Firmicutes-1]
MEISKIEAAIEAVLFSIGDAIHINKLCEVLGQDKKTTKRIINNLCDRYEEENRGIRIIVLEECYQLCSKPEYYEFIKQISHKSREFSLTDVLVETLSIIAYKQPITKLHIEEIRGVNSNHAVNKLVEYQLITEVGRLNAPGRPVLFGTSQEFLRCFGLESVEQMPFLEESQLSMLKNEVLEEVQLKLVD